MTFYFYDLETSGINPREQRIMQFAGQRTDMQLNPLGEPHNILIKLSDDVAPEPDATLVTGITPQMTLAEGITEVEFLKAFYSEVCQPETIFVGYNTIRFDDEFMRYLHYRNFYDPYEWQWKDKRSKWDLLDVVRMTRALRPDGIVWPLDSGGKPSNRLELISFANKLDHANAHDALSDVNATIAVARLIRAKQPKLFQYLLKMRSKQEVADLVSAGQPFVYSSGQYSSEYEKTAIVVRLADHPQKPGALVYDLRYDPEQFMAMNDKELTRALRLRHDEEGVRLPVKTLAYNKCPAVAPTSVLDPISRKRLKIDLDAISSNHKKLQASNDFIDKLLRVITAQEKDWQTSLLSEETEVDAQLYDGFLPNADKTIASAIRGAKPSDISEYAEKLQDKRLRALLPLYKARNFPASLTSEEREQWEAYRERKLLGGKKVRMQKFFMRLEELAAQKDLSKERQYLLEELQLYGQSIMPIPVD